MSKPNLRYQCDTTCGKCYVEEHMPDWSFLNGCFPRGIRVSDVDGFCEINGYVSFYEWKAPGAPMPFGQRRAYERMTRDAPRQQVLVVYGDKRDLSKALRIVRFIRGRRDPDMVMSTREFRERCQKWALWADQHGKP